jgi:hypothetical protein
LPGESTCLSVGDTRKIIDRQLFTKGSPSDLFLPALVKNARACQRHQPELCKLMCVYGRSSSKRTAPAQHPLSDVAGKRNRQTKESKEISRFDTELKRKIFIVQVVQPGLAGLMDGSVSAMAAVFAAAFATHNAQTACLS